MEHPQQVTENHQENSELQEVELHNEEEAKLK